MRGATMAILPVSNRDVADCVDIILGVDYVAALEQEIVLLALGERQAGTR